jgi:amino acid transporter
MNLQPESSPALRRAISRWEIVGLSVNDVIGSGVYLLPAAAAALLGASSTWAVILAGLAVGLLVLCFAEASSYFDEPGGGYLYTREAFGRFIGFEVGWMTWLARIASVASLANGLALATAYVWPAATAGMPRALLITATLVLLTWVNVIGVLPWASSSSTGRGSLRSRFRAPATWARRRCCCCSRMRASRIRRPRPASTGIPAAMCR